jgi:hypothetical protein
MDRAYAVILVPSTGHAVQAEQVLQRAGVRVKMIPTPRYLSSDCGSALRIRAVDRPRCETLLMEAGVLVERFEPLEA